MTTKPSTVNWTNVVSLISDIRVFIGSVYIPDVLTAALAYGGVPTNIFGSPSLFGQGFGCGRSLALGCMPQPYHPTGAKLMQNGLVTAAFLGPALTYGGAVNINLINEHTAGSSHYNNTASPLHPYLGETNPDMSSGYTWHKAPRYSNLPHEVGPLARMVASALGPAPTVVNDADTGTLTGWPGGAGNSIECATNLGFMDHLSAIPVVGNLGAYNVLNIVTTVLSPLVLGGGKILGIPGAAPLGALFSTLGRHACRALEAKYQADAIGCYATVAAGVPGGAAPGATTGIPWIGSVILDPNPGSQVYTYVPMPKSLKQGVGLTEAPRGALSHWITTEFRRIVNYQAVVPSTWNACGKDDLGVNGPIEQSLIGSYTGSTSLGDTSDMIINRILRTIHPYDICIACSVHIADTKGNKIAKVRLDPDGKVTREDVKAEA
jgi:Ni,Fe-hydrogenase I large subunit